MTYFNFQHIRGSRSEGVFVRSTLIGRVAVKSDWRSRLALRGTQVPLYRAIGLGGEALPELYPSRHDAAEALFGLFHQTAQVDAGS